MEEKMKKKPNYARKKLVKRRGWVKKSHQNGVVWGHKLELDWAE